MGRASCGGEYFTQNLFECVDLFCGVIIPAAAIKGFRRRGGKERELGFHKQQCLEIISEAMVLSSVKEELREAVEKSYREAISMLEVENG
jgi:hypothetical protein